MPQITIDDKNIKFELGDTILEVAAKSGISIPTLCWLPKTGHGNVCRICSVAVHGYDRFLPACATHAEDNMQVQTQSNELTDLRKNILTWVVAEGQHDCFMRELPREEWPAYQKNCMSAPQREHPCPADGSCTLQKLAIEYEVDFKDLLPITDEFTLDADKDLLPTTEMLCPNANAYLLSTTEKSSPITDKYTQTTDNFPHTTVNNPQPNTKNIAPNSNKNSCPNSVNSPLPHATSPFLDNAYPMITRDFTRCVQCGRCNSVCDIIQVNEAIPSQFGRHAEKSDWFPRVDYTRCTHCGECVQHCPTGALSYKKAYGLACKDDTLTRIRTTCPYCGMGCQQELVVKNGHIIYVNGIEGAEPNQGSLCVKGRFGYDFIYSKDRLTEPLIRQNDGSFKAATWDAALSLIAAKFSEAVQNHGTHSIAAVSCSRSINEDSYQMQKLFRSVFKTNNIDNCART